MNEALANEGQAPRFSAEEIAAFQSGNYPYQYPNVNWVDETFRKSGSTNKVVVVGGNATQGAVTDFDGNFQIKCKAG